MSRAQHRIEPNKTSHSAWIIVHDVTLTGYDWTERTSIERLEAVKAFDVQERAISSLEIDHGTKAVI